MIFGDGDWSMKCAVCSVDRGVWLEESRMQTPLRGMQTQERYNNDWNYSTCSRCAMPPPFGKACAWVLRTEFSKNQLQGPAWMRLSAGGFAFEVSGWQG